MALEVLGKTEPNSTTGELEHLACLGWAGVRENPNGIRVDQGECLWRYTARTFPDGHQEDCYCRRNRR